MADKLAVHVIVLWEHEIRVAATALEEMAKRSDDLQAAMQHPSLTDGEKETLDARFVAAAQTALQACAAALAGCDDMGAAITISSKPDPSKFKMAKKPRGGST